MLILKFSFRVTAFASFFFIALNVFVIVITTIAYNRVTNNRSVAFFFFVGEFKKFVLNLALTFDFNFSAIVVIVVISIIYYICLIAASVQLVRGSNNRDHTLLKPFLILMVIGIFLSFLQMIWSGIIGLILALTTGVFNIYFFICTYSLYEMLKKEKIMTQVRQTRQSRY